MYLRSTLNSKNIVIQNSRIENGDDCVSFKPGSIDIVVQNLACSGSHGISVGSLGQYVGVLDIVVVIRWRLDGSLSPNI